MRYNRKEQMNEIVGTMLETLTESKQSWREHLAFSGTFYKYNLANTLALQAHSTNLTACADRQTWNSIGRYINAGEKGILVYGSNNDFTHVFDISQTNSQAPAPYIWQFNDDHLEPVTAIMTEEYGKISNEGGYKDLKASIENHVETASLKYFREDNPLLIGSKLENIPVEQMQKIFTATLQDSVGYMVSSRLNLPQGLYDNDSIAFQFLEYFNTKQSSLLLGTATKDIGQNILRKIEREVKNIEKQRRIQHGQGTNGEATGRNDHEHRGYLERTAGTDTSNRQVRSDGDTVHEGVQSSGTGEPSRGRQLLRPLYGAEREGLRPSGEDKSGDEKAEPTSTDQQLYRDGEVPKLPTGDSRGNRLEGDSLHLNRSEPEGLTTTVSPFFVSKDGQYQYKVGDTVTWQGGEELTIGNIDPSASMFGVELHRPNTSDVRFAMPVSAFENDLAKLDTNEHLKAVQEQKEEQEQEEKQLFDVSELKEYDRVKLSDGRVALVADIYQNGKEFRLSIPRKDMPPSRLIIGKEELSALAAERLPHSGFDLFYGQLGNGITVSNRLESEYGDYKKLAHINTEHQVHFYDEDIPSDVKKEIEEVARTSSSKASATQDQSVFLIPPIERIDNLEYGSPQKYDYYVHDLVYIKYDSSENDMDTPFQIIDFYKGNVRIKEMASGKLWEMPYGQFDNLLSKTEANKGLLLRNHYRYRGLFPESETRYAVGGKNHVFLKNADDKTKAYLVTDFNPFFIHLRDIETNSKREVLVQTFEKNLDELPENRYLLKPLEYKKVIASENAEKMLEQADKIATAYDESLEQENPTTEQEEETEQLTFGMLPPQTDTTPKSIFEELNLSNGSLVYLEAERAFEITKIADTTVQLLDLTMPFPILRAMQLNDFEKLYRGNPFNFKESVQDVLPDHNSAETVAADYQPEEQEKNSFHPAADFQITDSSVLYEGGNKTKYRNNVAAIRLVKELEERAAPPTPEEQGILAKYVGWGGLPQAFEKDHATWGDEYTELKELLTNEEYQTAINSVLNAHYTSKEVINGVYTGLSHLGYRGGGNLVEPALGVGHFFGCIPEAMKPSKLYGVELDSISGRIAKQLYPSADIQITGYEKTQYPDNFHDIAVGNVPFGSYKLSDPLFRKHNFLIHDYFFAKTLDKVRPDGLIAFITSKGTLDKQNDYVRRYIAERANFLGAIRLPNNAFKANASTEVTTDIIFLQKKSDITQEDSQNWLSLKELPDSDILVNEYFADNPHMMLGTMEKGGGLYGNESETTLVSDGRELGEAIAQAVSFLPVNVYSSIELSADLEEEIKTKIPADPSVKNYGYTVVDDKIYQRENSIMLLRDDIVGKPRERVLGLIELKKQANHVIDIQVDSCSDETLAAEQAELNRLYDTFVKKHGYITSRGNSLVFRDDSDYPILCSLEEEQEDKTCTKADMFFKRTIQPYHEITHCDTAGEALAVSLNLRGYVDIHYMSELTGKEEKEVTKLLDGIIFKNPAKDVLDDEYLGWETADEYLSGKVIEKLEIAQESVEDDSRYKTNIDALLAVQPVPLEAQNIKVKMGAQWIDTEIIKDFIVETLNPSDSEAFKLTVSHNEYDGTWSVSGKPYVTESDVEASTVYGTKRMNAYHIVERLLNQGNIAVYDTVKNDNGNDSRVLNRVETIAAREKAEQVQNAFKAWIFRDPERRGYLVEKFNDLYNSERARQYDGSHLTFPHMSPTIELRSHQVNAVCRTIHGGNSLFYHCVGAGKTFTMIAAAMKMKQLGIIKKPIFVVPNHIIDQWAGEFLRLYPSANVLMTTERDFEKNKRQRFISRIATGDYDAVIIGHSQFEKIPMSAKTQETYLKEEMQQIANAIIDQKVESGDDNRSIIKSLIGTQMRLQERYDRLVNNEKKDDQIVFEKLDVDTIFVDESHNYKNLHFYTKMRDVAGIPQTAAQKSTDMFLKTRFINELHHTPMGVVFASGTAISNAMSEMYTLQKYLQYDTLQSKGLGAFDNWAGDFGETKTTLEIAPSGKGFRQRRRFSEFHNLKQLMQMFREFADVQTPEMLNLPVPKHEVHIEECEPTEELLDLMNELVERSDKINGGGVDPSLDNMLKITSEGRLGALDMRLIDPTAPDEAFSKVNKAVANIYRIWEDTAPDKLTQMVFSDLSTPVYGEQPTVEQLRRCCLEMGATEEEMEEQFDYVITGDWSDNVTSAGIRGACKELFDGTDYQNPKKFDIYNSIKDKLVSKGVPEAEIAFIHDAKTNKQKEKIFTKVRSGEIRVLLGSTFKMGAGTNVQDKLVALHHLDVPWRPSDVEQREGRILRQGNDNEKIDIYRYVTKCSFDSYSWQIIENKQRFISQVFSGEIVPDSMEEIDSKTLTYAEIKAIATGDPRIIRKSEVDNEVQRLQVLQATYNANRYRMEDNVLTHIPLETANLKERIESYKSDLDTLSKHTNEFSVKIGDKVFDKRADGGALLIEGLKKMPSYQNTTLGTYKGLDIIGFCSESGTAEIKRTYSILLKGKASYPFEVSGDPVGIITRLENQAKGISEQLKNATDRLSEVERQLVTTKVELEKPFEYEGQLSELKTEQAQLNAELTIDDAPQILLDDSEEEQEENSTSYDDSEMEEYECEEDMER